MSIDKLPEPVRQSELVKSLEKKLQKNQHVDFDHWGEFNRLRQKVKHQTGEMKILFPEFTPHDEENHLARLFGIADKLLGTERYEKMNAAELYLLACGLYAHDWGMAVGTLELDFIRSNAKGDIDLEVFSPLDDEKEVLLHFLQNQGVKKELTKDKIEISDELLRLYIRRTHAWRSGIRARDFFKSSGSNVSQALNKICQGHWLDFSELDDEQQFSAQLGVLGHTVNLRAIALYVRLVDLFDIADDRTPYAIWRFVAPKDKVAKGEWEKHRALSPVTFPVQGDGRCVRFDGTTSDPEIWAELEDLRSYCEEQIKGTMDLLARYPDDRHQLDIRRLEWKIIPERFKPVNIRFEFHRQRMFEILADEVYQGDSYVFLREMLQNSIDAIRLRIELIKKRAASTNRRSNFGLGFDDAIYFDVSHGINGDAIISCRDSGIGMDEYIIRNYLSVAGVSYYQSDEFKHLGLTMDPISRFGIGILSCFMVADHIEITTYREPQNATKSEPLHIDIPEATRQFRVYKAPEDTPFGTTVTVHVLGKKLREDVTRENSGDSLEHKSKLKVAEYLSEIAKFVEFPIVIDEDGQRTIILHPEKSTLEADDFTLGAQKNIIKQLSKKYPWHKEFAPRDIEVAQECLTQKTFDLKKDLGLSQYEGTLTYVLPHSDIHSCHRAYERYNTHEYDYISVNYPEDKKFLVRIKAHYGQASNEGITASSKTNHHTSIFRDGLLIPNASETRRNLRRFYTEEKWPTPSLCVNLPKHIAGVPDMSRRDLRDIDICWDTPIWKAVLNYLKNNEIQKALSQSPIVRKCSLAKLALFYRLTIEDIRYLISSIEWPVDFLDPVENTITLDNKITYGVKIFKAPDFLCGDSYIQPEYRRNKNIIANWSGEQCIKLSRDHSAKYFEDIWDNITYSYLQRRLAPVGIRFLKPPFPGLHPIQQEEYIFIEPEKINEMDLAERMMCDPLSLQPKDYCNMSMSFSFKATDKLLKAAPYYPPYDSYFTGENSVPNLNHPVTIFLLRCVASVKLHQLKNTLSAIVIGELSDFISRTCENLSHRNTQAHLDKLWNLAKENELFELSSSLKPLQEEDYIPYSKNSTFMVEMIQNDNRDGRKNSLTDKYIRPFGQVLNDVLIEDVPSDVVDEIKND